MMNTSTLLFITALIVSAACSVHAAPEAAQIIKADSLREKPFSDAKILTRLTLKQSVNIVARNGAWYQISAAGKMGWVGMLSVRKTMSATAASAGSLSAIASGRTSTGNIVATTGIRGLNEENLAQAAYDEKAITKAESFRVNPNDVAPFAAEGKLKTRAVPVLPTPSKGEK